MWIPLELLLDYYQKGGTGNDKPADLPYYIYKKQRIIAKQAILEFINIFDDLSTGKTLNYRNTPESDRVRVMVIKLTQELKKTKTRNLTYDTLKEICLNLKATVADIIQTWPNTRIPEKIKISIRKATQAVNDELDALMSLSNIGALFEQEKGVKITFDDMIKKQKDIVDLQTFWERKNIITARNAIIYNCNSIVNVLEHTLMTHLKPPSLYMTLHYITQRLIECTNELAEQKVNMYPLYCAVFYTNVMKHEIYTRIVAIQGSVDMTEVGVQTIISEFAKYIEKNSKPESTHANPKKQEKPKPEPSREQAKPNTQQQKEQQEEKASKVAQYYDVYTEYTTREAQPQSSRAACQLTLHTDKLRIKSPLGECVAQSIGNCKALDPKIPLKDLAPIFLKDLEATIGKCLKLLSDKSN